MIQLMFILEILKEMKKNNNITFEEALRQLESISKKVEDSNLTLDELVDAFKKGSELYDICNNKLTTAKLEIEKIEKSKDII